MGLRGRMHRPNLFFYAYDSLLGFSFRTSLRRLALGVFSKLLINGSQPCCLHLRPTIYVHQPLRPRRTLLPSTRFSSSIFISSWHNFLSARERAIQRLSCTTLTRATDLSQRWHGKGRSFKRTVFTWLSRLALLEKYLSQR